MRATCHLDPGSDLLWIDLAGPMGARSLLAMASRGLRAGIAQDRIVLDIRRLDIHFSGEDLRMAAQKFAEPAGPPTSCQVAVLVDSLVQFGTARQFQVFFGDLWSVELFRDVAGAYEWMHCPSPRTPARC